MTGNRTLAFLRSRLLGAVTLPALIGAAWAYRHGAWAASGAGRGAAWLRLGLALVGLAAVELLNLFGADYVNHRSPGADPPLPGNPVASRLDPRRIPAVLLALAAVGAGTLLYFVLAVSPAVLAFLLPAAAVGALYVFSPFPFAFLATALVPPLVAGGVAFALSGRAEAGAFLSAVPVALVSVGVIDTYRVAYRKPPPTVGVRVAAVLLPYVLADAVVAVLLLTRLYPRAGYFALLPAIVFPGWAARLLLTVRADPVPATAVGVLLHSALSLAIAAGLGLG